MQCTEWHVLMGALQKRGEKEKKNKTKKTPKRAHQAGTTELHRLLSTADRDL